MDYVIIVNDNGELKTLSASEIMHEARGTEAAEHLDVLINAILDERSAAEKATAGIKADCERIDRERGYDLANETVDAKTRS